MSYPVSEKFEIIRIVERSHHPARRTLAQIGIPPTTFYRWYDCYVRARLGGAAGPTLAAIKGLELNRAGFAGGCILLTSWSLRQTRRGSPDLTLPHPHGLMRQTCRLAEHDAELLRALLQHLTSNLESQLVQTLRQFYDVTAPYRPHMHAVAKRYTIQQKINLQLGWSPPAPGHQPCLDL